MKGWPPGLQRCLSLLLLACSLALAAPTQAAESARSKPAANKAAAGKPDAKAGPKANPKAAPRAGQRSAQKSAQKTGQNVSRKAPPRAQAKTAQARSKAQARPASKQARAAASAKNRKAVAQGPRGKRAQAVAGNGLRPPKARAKQRKAPPPPPRPSFGQIYGLHAVDDMLDLKSSVALVVDQETDEVLFSKNSDAVLPIASITKLMTALVVMDAALPLHEELTVAQDDVHATAGSRSRLQPGTRLSRGEMLHLALMASENRAAHVLGRTYPGGSDAFVAAMNRKALELGMFDTRYVEPTGLSSDNQSSARDLTQLVRAAMLHPVIRELSTAPEASVPVGRKQLQFRNTNGLVHNPEWEIGVQKTGYIAAAGRCVVLQAEMAGRKLIMVLLDSAGRYSRIGDAERLRKWLSETQLAGPGAKAMTAPGLGSTPVITNTSINAPAAVQLR
jgi:D-alanyl-D-alanine endopeptidase (penicillin-binding protein 7)